MPNRETRHERKKKRQEMIEQAMREREVRAAGPELTGPHGVGAPRVTGPEGNQQMGGKKGRLPE